MIILENGKVMGCTQNKRKENHLFSSSLTIIKPIKYHSGITMKTIIIADCHGQPHLITNVLDHAKSWNRLIFAGDIIDIGYDAVKCLDILKENNAELLWGNHDAAVVINRLIWPQNAFDQEAKQTIIHNIDNFKVAININNVLVTHAGLSKKLYAQYEHKSRSRNIGNCTTFK